MAVPTRETPINIDAALRDFRSALKTAFIDNFGFYANISKPEFDNSLFMKNFEERKFLVTDTTQYRGKMQGLWLWDLVHPVTTKDGLTTLDAIDKVTLEAEQQLSQIAPDEETYQFDSCKNCYDHAVAQIGPELSKMRTPPKSRALDRFITLSDVTLGYRSRSGDGVSASSRKRPHLV